MKKIAFPIIAAFIAATVFTAFDSPKNTTQKDYTDCIEKYDAAWGEKCGRCVSMNETFRVKFKNVCTDKIDVLVAVQEMDKSWRPFSHNAVAPNDSIIAYACVGTGKYLYWARKTGDKEIIFPTIEQITKDYK